MTGLTIGQLAERTEVPAGTLRMWERRHGFPAPERMPSGHRRYPDSTIEAVRRVANERAAGMSLTGAIARVKRTTDAAAPAGDQRRPPRQFELHGLSLARALRERGIVSAAP